MKKIEIIVSPKGEITLTTSGFTAAECKESSRLLESALGEKHSEKLTPEFHQTVITSQIEEREF